MVVMELRRVYTSVRLLTVVFSHDISNTVAARITKRDIEMFRGELCLFLGQKVKVMSHNDIAHVGLCTLVAAGLFWLSVLAHIW